ncbi:MAG: sugar phosphate isomerase/epimerase family protein [Candidatus Methanomethylophilaceae archaeon]|jgi:sugar phosphate isomerase/epimerase
MIGMSCTGFSAFSVEEIAEKVSKKFTLWEIFSEAEHSIGKNWSRLRDIKKSYNLEFSVHTPISDTNIAALTDRMREASVLEMIHTAEVSSEIGAKLVVVHPGLSSLSVPGTEERAKEHAKKSLRTLDRISREYGIVFAVENMPNFPPMLGKTAEELAELIEGTNLSVCFDIGHANTTNQIDSVISLLGDRFANVHLHDNMGDTDSHLTVGDGNIDFPKAIDALSRYRGNYIIESKSFESAVESARRLSVLFD